MRTRWNTTWMALALLGALLCTLPGTVRADGDRDGGDRRGAHAKEHRRGRIGWKKRGETRGRRHRCLPAQAAGGLTAQITTETPSFLFLPPVGTEPQEAPAFDATLVDLLAVDVFERGAAGDVLLATLTSAGEGPEQVRLETETSYQVNVQADTLGLQAGQTCVIQVRVLDTLLGTAVLTWDNRNSLPVAFAVAPDPFVRAIVLRAGDVDGVGAALALVGEFDLDAAETLTTLADAGYDANALAAAALAVFELGIEETGALLADVGIPEPDVLEALFQVYAPTPDELAQATAQLVADGTFPDSQAAARDLHDVLASHGTAQEDETRAIVTAFLPLFEDVVPFGTWLATALDLTSQELADVLARAGALVQEVADVLQAAYLMSPEEIVQTLAAMIRDSAFVGAATDLARAVADWIVQQGVAAADGVGYVLAAFVQDGRVVVLAVVDALRLGYDLAADALAGFLAEHDAEVQLIADALAAGYQLSPREIAESLAALIESGAIQQGASAAWTAFVEWVDGQGEFTQAMVGVLIETVGNLQIVAEAFRDGLHVTAEVTAELLSTELGQQAAEAVAGALQWAYDLGAPAMAEILARLDYPIEVVTDVVVQLYNTPIDETVDFLVDLVQYYQLDTVEFWQQAGVALFHQFADPLADSRVAEALRNAGVTAARYVAIVQGWGLQAADAARDLKDTFLQSAAEVASLLADTAAPFEAVLDVLVDVYQTPINETVEALAGVVSYYAVDATAFWQGAGPMVAARSGATADQMASALQAVGITADQYLAIVGAWGQSLADSARLLVDAFGNTAAGVAAKFRALGHGATAIGSALRTGLGLSDSSTSAALRSAGFGPTDIGRMLVQVYGATRSRIAVILKSYGHSAATIVIVLRNVAGATASSAAAALKSAAFGLSEIASAVVNQFSLTFAQARDLLTNLGYSLADVLSALASLF